MALLNICSSSGDTTHQMAISTRRPVKAPCELLHTVIGSWSACQFPQTRNVQEQDPVPSGKYVRQQWEIRMPSDAGRVLIHVPDGCFREKDLLQHQEECYCTLCANAKVLTLTSRKKGFINSESNAVGKRVSGGSWGTSLEVSGGAEEEKM